MRALETVSTIGMSVILALFAVLTYDAVASGFRGVTSGEVPLWSLSGASGAAVADAFALIGFSFYLHPLMMPMLSEMPPGPVGVRILSDSVTLVIMGVAFVTISFLGAMGAAAFGDDTQGDIMMNQLLPPGLPSLLFALAMLLYLASCIPPIVLSLRCYLDFIIAGPRASFRCAFHPAGRACVWRCLVPLPHRCSQSTIDMQHAPQHRVGAAPAIRPLFHCMPCGGR